MTTTLADHIKVFDDLIAADECRRLVETFDAFPSLHDEVSNDRCPNFVQLNVSGAIHAHAEFGQAQSRLLACFLDALAIYQRELPVRERQFPDRFRFETVRIKKYRPGGVDAFDLHTDVGDHESARRFLAFLLYLNDVPKGGETVFPDLALQIVPKAGSVLVFPPLWMWRHEGRAPQGGPKYIVSSYLHYL